MKKYLLVEMPDLSVWRVPVQVIADSMTDYYVERNGEDREMAKAETEQLFTENEDEIEYWASENMNWEEVKSHAVRVGDGDADYRDGWLNGIKCVTDDEEQKEVC